MKKTLEKHEIEAAACAAHEVDRAWNWAIGAHVNPRWDLLSEEQKQTARNAVIGVVTHDFNAEQTHAAWHAEMKSKGWTVGAVKDLEKKEHPCLVPWNDLPMEFRAKDELWVTTIRNFVSHYWRIPQ